MEVHAQLLVFVSAQKGGLESDAINVINNIVGESNGPLYMLIFMYIKLCT